MKYVRLFDTAADYTAYEASTSYTTPNVCGIDEEITSGLNGVRYNPYVAPPLVYDAGTIVLYGTSNHDFKFVEYDDYTKDAYSGYIPQGVVVVPNNHTTDGTVRIMSLKNMSCANPHGGSTAQGGNDTQMCCGGNGTDVPGLTNQPHVPTTDATGATSSDPTIVLNQQDAYLPSDYMTGTQSGLDPQGKYYSGTSGSKYGISPYLSDGSQNPHYLSGATSEMDGRVNTATLKALHTADGTLGPSTTAVTDGTGSTTYALAACCYLYETEGISLGNWHLPACGELCYLLARYNAINSALAKLMQQDSTNAVRMWMREDSSPNQFGYWLWSSSELNTIYARGIYVGNGGVYGYGKGNRNATERVRAFASLKV